MKAKEVFNQLNQLEKEVKSKTLLAQTYRNVAGNMKSPTISDMPKNPTNHQDLMSDMLIKAMTLEEEIVSTVLAIAQLKAEITRHLMQIDIVYQEILIQRYFNHQEWLEISRTMCYSRSGIFKLHNLALAALSEELIKE